MDKKIDITILQQRTRRKMLKIAGAVGAVIVGVFVLIMLMEKTVNTRDINLVTVDRGDIETTVPATGSVVPAYEEVINSPVTTRLLAAYAMPGDTVTPGTPLLGLDLDTERIEYEKMVDNHNVSMQELTQLQLQSQTTISELEMQIEVKQMDVKRMQIDVVNERRLDSIGSGTGDRVRLAETAFRTAELELAQLRRRLENERMRCKAAETVQALNVGNIEKDLEIKRSTLMRGNIEAPCEGVLTFIINEIGTQVVAGEKVAVVSNLSTFKILGEIAERASEHMSVGSRVMIRIGRSELEGYVTNITPQSKGGVVQFVVTPDDPRNSALRAGVRAELYIAYGFRDNAVRLPAGAYYNGEGDYDMFVADGNDRLVRRRVRLGAANRQYVEVISGLQPGDRVAIGDMSNYTKYKKLKFK